MPRGGDWFRERREAQTLGCGTPPPAAFGASAPRGGFRRAMETKNESIVPGWDGAGGAYAKEQYIQEAKAYVLGTKVDERPLCGVRLWRQLRGEAKDNLRDIDLEKLALDGASGLFKAIEEAFPEGKLRQLPRLYRQLFKESRFRGSMETYLADRVRAKNQLEHADKDTKVSEGIMGYLVLTGSGLDDEEVKHVLGLANGEMKYTGIRKHLIELYPHGSYHRAQRAHHRGYMAEDVTEEEWADAEAYMETPDLPYYDEEEWNT